jgi:DNA-binding beta-propeller fold protein YncE
LEEIVKITRVMKSPFPLMLAIAISASAGAQAQLVISGNDGKQMIPNDNPPGMRPDSISVLDLSHYPPKRLASVAAPAGMIGPPDAVAVAHDSSFAIVTAAQKINPADPAKLILDDTGSVLDLADPRNPKVVQSIHAGPGASGVSINRAGTLALVASTGDDGVTVFSITHMRLTQIGKITLQSGASPTDVVFAPDGRNAYVSEHGNKGSKLEILAVDHAKVADTGQSIVTGRGPYGAAITPDGKYLVNTNTGGAIPAPAAEAAPAGAGTPARRGGTVTLVDLKTRQILDTVEVGGISEHVALSTSGEYVEATVAIGQERGFIRIYAIDGGKLREVASAKSGNWPQGATWSKDDHTILLQCAGDRDIEVYKFDGKNLTPDPNATIVFYDRPGAIATAYSR